MCACALAVFASVTPAGQAAQAPQAVRIATFNIEDLREEDVARRDNPRLKAVAEVIQRVAPNILFLNAYNDLTCGMVCPADFNGDSMVDDADFVIFAGAYDALLCT